MNSPSPIRVAIVGCGQIADLHIAEIQKIAGAQLVAVCDTNELMAEQAAVRFGVPKYYTDFERLLKEQQPGVIHITTPPQSHLSLGKLAVECGAHAYVEKPFTVDASEAEELIACAERAGKQICVGHNFSFDPAAVEARRLVASGRLGEIHHVDSVFSYNLDGAFGKIMFEKPKHWIHRLPGKLFHNVISHAVYNVTDYIGDPMPEIHAFGFKFREKVLGDQRDAFNDELRAFIKGHRCTGNIVFSSHIRPMHHYMRLHGTKGTVQVDFNARTVSFDHASTLPGSLGRLVLPFPYATEQLGHSLGNVTRFAKADLQFNDGMNRLFRTFYQAIREGKPSPIPMPEAVRVTRILDEIFRQAQPNYDE
jgi:predicted dehydrogenase